MDLSGLEKDSLPGMAGLAIYRQGPHFLQSSAEITGAARVGEGNMFIPVPLRGFFFSVSLACFLLFLFFAAFSGF